MYLHTPTMVTSLNEDGIVEVRIGRELSEVECLNEDVIVEVRIGRELSEVTFLNEDVIVEVCIGRELSECQVLRVSVAFSGFVFEKAWKSKRIYSIYSLTSAISQVFPLFANPGMCNFSLAGDYLRLYFWLSPSYITMSCSKSTACKRFS